MHGKRKELILIYLIIGFAIMSIISALLSASFFFIIMTFLSIAVIMSIGVTATIMIKLRKWEWATITEHFKDGSSLTSLKYSIIGIWGAGFVVCIFSLLVMLLIHQSP